MTWQAGSLPDPDAIYYRLCRRQDPACWEAPLARERMVPEGAQDQGWLRLSMSAWGTGDYFMFFEQQVYRDFGWGGAEFPETISNYVVFQIP
mgnify:CR=1 FL=1